MNSTPGSPLCQAISTILSKTLLAEIRLITWLLGGVNQIIFLISYDTAFIKWSVMATLKLKL